MWYGVVWCLDQGMARLCCALLRDLMIGTHMHTHTHTDEVKYVDGYSHGGAKRSKTAE